MSFTVTFDRSGIAQVEYSIDAAETADGAAP